MEDCPSSVILLFHGSESFRVVEVWRRLVESSEILTAGYLIACVGENAHRVALEMMPKSMYSKLIVIDSVPEVLRNESGCGLLMSKYPRLCLLAMIGYPTEEAWDRFLEAWRANHG